jgi:hypothetical protein
MNLILFLTHLSQLPTVTVCPRLRTRRKAAARLQ